MCIRFVCRKLSVAVAICVLLSACNHEESSTEPNQAGDTINNTTNNNYFLSPTAVSTVFPAEVRVGERFFITGQNFGANDGSATLALSVNGVAVTNIESWTDTQIIATMPSGAGTGNVAVSVDGVAGAPGFVVVPWVADNPTNVKLSNSTAGAADNPAILNDGFGGTIIVWEEHKSATGSKDILAQRLDSSGAEMWTANGVVVSSATYDQQKPKLVADGVGGAIIVWEDYRNTDTNGTTMDLYAQRINSTGVVQWVTDGVVISTASGHQSNAEIVSDGASGAIIVWQDERVANIDIYAQRIDAAGAAQWLADGKVISSAANGQYAPKILSDGSGGAYLAWQDARANPVLIYVDRINSSGVSQWTTGGVAVTSTLPGTQQTPLLVSDSAGGLIVVWSDARNDGFFDIFAQSIDSTGTTKWGTDGNTVAAVGSLNEYPYHAISDGAGGVIVSWEDSRNSGSTGIDIYAQRLDYLGTAVWTTNGVAISQGANAQYSPTMVSDGDEGMIVVWQDLRADGGDVYVQRITSDGIAQWETDGKVIANPALNQYWPRITADGAGGAVITWAGQTASFIEIRAQGITASGKL